MKCMVVFLAAVFSGSLMARSLEGDYLVKVAPEMKGQIVMSLKSKLPTGSVTEDLKMGGWLHVKVPAQTVTAQSKETLFRVPGVLSVESNEILSINATWKVRDPAQRAALLAHIQVPPFNPNPPANPPGGIPGLPGGIPGLPGGIPGLPGGIPGLPGGGAGGGGGLPGGIPGLPGFGGAPAADNPAFPLQGSGGTGADPLANKQWGMMQIGAPASWGATKGSSAIVVAVIDSGVDYTHEDLVDNIWHNQGEMGRDANGGDKSTNNIDDDRNGYIDDVIGWDFAGNDNKPYDLTADMMTMLLSGGNPGHGTHCAGNIAARADNGKGIAGVAPGVRIMPLRFITQSGQGDTASAIKAITYAVNNGAKILSNSWGSEGDDPADQASTVALQDAIRYAMSKNVLFIAAAGNGHQGVGYDNDSDPKPGVPASYNIDNIISVAAIDEAGNMGSFSNWGARTVHLAAPGVKVFSTVATSDLYSDTLITIPGLGSLATWDGTSMAAPHVAGAAALYWSMHPNKTWREVKSAILATVKRNPVLQGKTVSGGQLDVQALSRY